MFSIMDSAAETRRPVKTLGDRACDQCKVRKVKCNSKRPCEVCTTKGFECTYDRARKKRGPAGKRIEEIRRMQSKSLDGTTEGSVVNDSGLERVTTGSTFCTNEGWSPESPISAAYWPKDAIDQVAGAPLQAVSANMSEVLPQGMTPTALQAEDGAPIDPMLTSISNMPDYPFPSLPIDSPSSSWDPFQSLLQQDLPPISARTDIWPSHINEATLLPWIDVYFKRLHPTIPILDRAEMYHDMLVRKHHTDPQYGAMLLALCAFAMTQPIQIHERADTPSRSMQARMMMEESVKMRVAADFGEHPSLEMILTSFFLFACLFGANQHKAARHKLREAVDLAQSIGMHLPQAYEDLTIETKERWLRTYLVLSVTERAYALQRLHPIDLRGRPGISARFMQGFDPNAATDYLSRLLYTDQTDATAMTGLMYLMDTFDAIDERVIDCYIGFCRFSDGVCEAFDRRRALQTFRAQRLARESCISGNISFAPNISPVPLARLAESQQADISITQFWLLNRLWNLCLSHELIRATSDRPELRFDFACYIAKAALLTCNSFTLASIEVHGVGFAEKLHDLATGVITALQSAPYAIMLDTTLEPSEDDIVSLAGVADSSMTVRELLQGFEGLMQAFRGGENPYRGRLESTLSTVMTDQG